MRWIICVFVALAIAGCSTSNEKSTNDTIGESSGALTIASNEAGPALGEVIGVEVRPNGDIVCSKADGGPWTSAEGGHVEFYLRDALGAWSNAGYVEYDPQPGADNSFDLFEITMPGAAFQVGVGAGYAAQCIAYPYINIPLGNGWEDCSAGNAATSFACTRSDIYDFSIASDGVLDLTDTNASCGDGAGKAKGNVVCVPNRLRPAGNYFVPFECSLGAQYEAKLVTASGETALIAGDAEGHTYGSSKSTGSVDRIEFVASAFGGQCFAIVYAVQPSKFILKVKEVTVSSVEGGKFSDLEALIKSAQPGDLLLNSHYPEDCQWYKDTSIIPATFCHLGIVSSAWPNFLTVEAPGSGIDTGEFARYAYWTDPAQTLVALLRVPQADALDAVQEAKTYIGTPYKFQFDWDDSSTVYCSQLAYLAYAPQGISLNDTPGALGGAFHFLTPDAVADSINTVAVGYYYPND